MKFLLPIFFLFVSSLLFSQHPLVTYTHEFEVKDDDRWYLKNDGETDSYVNDEGALIFKSMKPESWFYIRAKSKIKPKENYIIKARVKGVAGTGDEYYGIVWGMEDQVNLFTISDDRDYRVSERKSEFKHFNKWTKDDVVKPNGEWNDLRVEHINGSVKFFINEKQVYSRSVSNRGMEKVGVFINGDVTMACDYIRIDILNRPIDLVVGAMETSKRERLGWHINDRTNSDFAPVICPDGKTLYFTRYGHHIKGIEGDEYDSFWKSTWNGSSWSPASLIEGHSFFNQDESNVGHDISSDGNTFLVLGKYSKGKYVESGYSTITAKGNEKWTPAEGLDIKNFKDHHKGNEMYANFNPDGKSMLITLSPEEDSDDRKIVVTFLKENGKWTEPKDLGPTINKPGYPSGSAIMAADGKTMYFYSSALPGYGSRDLFVTKRLDNSWTKWSKPKNLGPHINSQGWDGYFVIPAKGDYAYMSSDDNGIGDLDLYRVELPEEAKPDPVELVHGRVLSSETNEPLNAIVTLRDLETDEEVGRAITDPSTGKFDIILPTGNAYALFAVSEGYYSQHENIDLTNLTDFKEESMDLFLSPVKVGETIKLNNIFFVQSKSVILPKSLPELNYLVDFLKENDEIRIRVEGHTDNTGSHNLNLQLSQERADKIKDYLMKKGISKKRIESKGFGGKQPIADNKDPKLRHLNRRVDFVIIE